MKTTKKFTPDKCTHCNQFVNYELSLSRGHAICLVKIYNYVKTKGINAVHLDKELLEKEIITANEKGNVPQLRHWKLLDQLEESGNYAINQFTVDFLKGSITVPKKVIVAKGIGSDAESIFDQTHFFDTEHVVSIKDLLKKDNPYWEGDFIRYGNVIGN